MLVGHISAALIAKQVEPRLSLGILLLASLLADVLLFALILTGVEAVEFRTSLKAAAYYSPLRVAFSHSLVTLAIFGAAAAVFCARRMKSTWAAAVLGLTLVSHWVLDLFTHPVLPVLPAATGRPIYAGSTLARWIVIVMVVEAVIWAGALFLYVRDSRGVNAAGRYAFWSGAVAWTWIWWANLAGPPREASAAPIEMLIVLALIVAWGFWMNRARSVTSSPFS